MPCACQPDAHAPVETRDVDNPRKLCWNVAGKARTLEVVRFRAGDICRRDGWLLERQHKQEE